MNRIETIFAEQAASGRRALMPFITAGDPSVRMLPGLLLEAERSGASLCEIGIPFSDPIADGPVIQASMTHALNQGVRVEAIFKAVASIRSQTQLGLVAMVSYSIVHRMGLERFIGEAAASGFDGLIFPDLPLEASEPARTVAHRAGLVLSLLIAPTSSPERAASLAEASSGFAYIVSRAGITGESTTLPEGLADRLATLRRQTSIPLAVGFGVSTPEHVQSLSKHAEGVIVGSALVRRIAENRDAGDEKVVAEAGRFIRELATGLPEGASASGAFRA
ncbi:MAG: tryptophan synthase subunit alpha [Phycisphaeraceae bacterium]